MNGGASALPFQNPKAQALAAARAALRAFVQHGVEFVDTAGAQGIARCPFCGKDRHFYANSSTMLWDCKSCQKSGGIGRFFEHISARNQKHPLLPGMLRSLAQDRKLSIETLKRWGVGWSGSQFTIPIYGANTLVDLRRYSLGGKTVSSAGAKAGLLGWKDLNDSSRSAARVWLCEGEWDCMALDEALRKENRPDIVVGVTGAGIFKNEWAMFFHSREIIAAYDNDEAGKGGAGKAQRALSGIASLRFIAWSDSLPSGFDVRDLWKESGQSPRKFLERLESFISDSAPQSAASASSAAAAQSASAPVGAASAPAAPQQPEGKGMEADEVIAAYRKWLFMPDPKVLDVMFGTMLANRLEGDPLWLFLIAPPGGCKTELMMSLSKAPLTMMLTSLTPHTLISGASFAGGGDPSLLPLLNGKVLIIKDFTTILNMHPNARDEIFGVLRDAYDGKADKPFGTGVIRSYYSKFGIIAGVTPVIDMFSGVHATLGERFLKYRIEQSRRISGATDAIKAAIANIDREGAMRAALESIGTKVLSRKVVKTEVPRIGEDFRDRFVGLAQWVALLRAVVVRERYTGEVHYKPTAEVGTRLAKQLAKLGIGIALYRRKDAIDEEIYSICAKAARDTVPDRVEEIVKQIFVRKGAEAASSTEISEWTNLPQGTCTRLLQDLTLLHIVQKESQGNWRLSPSLLRLMNPLNLYQEFKAWQSSKERIKRLPLKKQAPQRKQR